MVYERYRLPSNHILLSGRISLPLSYDRYTRHELGWMQHQHLHGDQHGLISHPQPHPPSHHQTHPYPQPQYHLNPNPHSSHSYEAIQREIEKEIIRQEIIASEIRRRRALEDEVWRELMMEREIARHGGSNGFSFGSPSPMGLDFHMRPPLAETRTEERSLETGIVLPLMQRDILNNGQEGGVPEALPFQRASNDVRTVRNSEVTSVLEGSNEKKKIVLLAKPTNNITGVKRDRSGSGAIDTPSDHNLKTKAKKEWRCALCHISAPNERGLNQHLKGKKHKMKEAETAAPKAQKSAENSRAALGTHKVANSGKIGDARSGIDGAPLSQRNLNLDNLKKDESVKPQEVQKKDKTNKEAYQFWCETCQIGVGNQKIMDSHKQGRKHKRRLINSLGVSLVCSSNQNEGAVKGENCGMTSMKVWKKIT